MAIWRLVGNGDSKPRRLKNKRLYLLSPPALGHGGTTLPSKAKGVGVHLVTLTANKHAKYGGVGVAAIAHGIASRWNRRDRV